METAAKEYSPERKVLPDSARDIVQGNPVVGYVQKLLSSRKETEDTSAGKNTALATVADISPAQCQADEDTCQSPRESYSGSRELMVVETAAKEYSPERKVLPDSARDIVQGNPVVGYVQKLLSSRKETEDTSAGKNTALAIVADISPAQCQAGEDTCQSPRENYSGSRELMVVEMAAKEYSPERKVLPDSARDIVQGNPVVGYVQKLLSSREETEDTSAGKNTALATAADISPAQCQAGEDTCQSPRENYSGSRELMVVKTAAKEYSPERKVLPDSARDIVQGNPVVGYVQKLLSSRKETEDTSAGKNTALATVADISPAQCQAGKDTCQSPRESYSGSRELMVVETAAKEYSPERKVLPDSARDIVQGNPVVGYVQKLLSSRKETEDTSAGKNTALATVADISPAQCQAGKDTCQSPRESYSGSRELMVVETAAHETASKTSVETTVDNLRDKRNKVDTGELPASQSAKTVPSDLRKKGAFAEEPAGKTTMETALLNPCKRCEKGDTRDTLENKSVEENIGIASYEQGKDSDKPTGPSAPKVISVPDVGYVNAPKAPGPPAAAPARETEKIKYGHQLAPLRKQADKRKNEALGFKGEDGHSSDNELFSSTSYGRGNEEPRNSWEELEPAGKTATAPVKSSLGVMLDGFRRAVGLDNNCSLDEGRRQEAEQRRRARNAKDRFSHEKLIERAGRYERSGSKGTDEELFSSTSYGGGNEKPRDSFGKDDSGLAGGPEKSVKKSTMLDNLKRAFGLGDTCSIDEEREGVEIELESTADARADESEERADSEEINAAQSQDLHRSVPAQASVAVASKKPEPVFDSQLVAALPATAVEVRNSTATQIFSGHHQAISDFRKGKKPGKNRTLQQVGEKQARYTENGGLSLEVSGNYSYLRALGSRSDVNLADGLPGFRSRGFGFEAGLFHVFDTKLLAGMMMAGEHSKASLKGKSGSVDLDSLRLGPFFSWKPGNWYIDGALTVGQHDMKAKGRDSITDDKYKGNFGMSEWAGWLGTGYDIHLDKYVPNLTVTPMAEFLYLDTRLSNLGLNNQNSQKIKVKGGSHHDRIDRYGVLSSYVVPGSGGNTEIHGGVGIQNNHTASHKVHMRHADASRNTREKRGKTDGRTKWFAVGVNQKLDASKNISFDLNSSRGNNSRSNGASATFEYKFK